MREILLVALCTTMLLLGCRGVNNKSNQTESINQISTPISLKSELPPEEEIRIEKGKIKMDINGYSIGQDTELTEMLKQLKVDRNGKIVIAWTWDCSPKYADMPMSLTYSKRNNSLTLTYTSTNVKEEFKNVYPECFIEFLQSGDRSLYNIEKYCSGAEFDFNNREMKIQAIGEEPHQSELDGTVKIVRDFLIQNIGTDIKFIEWSKVSPMGKDWIVRCKYEAKTGGSAIVNEWFYIQDSKVVNVNPAF